MVVDPEFAGALKKLLLKHKTVLTDYIVSSIALLAAIGDLQDTLEEATTKVSEETGLAKTWLLRAAQNGLEELSGE
jgi:hypothetical protein